MTTVARLSVWVPPERMDEFEEAYKRQLAPILQRHGLVEFSERGRTTVDTVFSRLFAFDKPRLIAAAEQALEQDSAWQELLQGLGARFGTTGEDSMLRHSLRVYAAPAGPARPSRPARESSRACGRALVSKKAWRALPYLISCKIGLATSGWQPIKEHYR